MTSIVEKIESFELEQLKPYIDVYIEEHQFIRSRNMAPILMNKIFDLYWTHPKYDYFIDKWTRIIAQCLKKYYLEGKLTIYKTTNRGNLYVKA